MIEWLAANFGTILVALILLLLVAGIIASLIREKDIDRKQLSAAAGTIGTITWREINVRG